MNSQTFLESFGYIAESPGGIEKIRRLIMDLAVRGLLSEQLGSDEPVDLLLAGEELTSTSNAEKRQPKMGAVVDAPFTLPPTWRWAHLGDLASDIHYGLTAKASTKALEPAFVRITDIKNNEIHWQNVPGCVDADPDIDRFRLNEGDILVARSGSVGVSTVVRDLPRAAVFASYLIRVVPAEQWLAGWWPILSGSRFYWSQVESITTGSAQQNINGTNMRKWLIPVPPLQEQRRIVERVNELLDLCNELAAQQEARAESRVLLTSATLSRLTLAYPEGEFRKALNAFADSIDLHLAPGDGDIWALKQLRRTILDLAIRGRLAGHGSADEPVVDLLERISAERDRLVYAGEIRRPRARTSSSALTGAFDLPPGWQWTSLGQLALSSDAGWSPACLPHRRNDESQWAVLKVSAVSWGSFRADEHKVLTEGLVPRPQIEVQDGDFVMSRANTSELVGRSVVVDDPPARLMLSDKHVRLRFLDRVCAEYVNLVNGSTHARGYYSSVATGTSDSMRNITRDQILALPVPIPPLAEQKRVVGIVKALYSLCDELEQQFADAESSRRDLCASVVSHAATVRV
jgi:type I restriction enzyme S subunit